MSLDSALADMIPAAEKGLYRAGNIILTRAVSITPMDRGFLRSSAFVRPDTPKSVVVGYTANYAYHVHQASGRLRGKTRRHGRGRYWDNGEPQFLKKATEQSRSAVIAAIRDEMIKSAKLHEVHTK